MRKFILRAALGFAWVALVQPVVGQGIGQASSNVSAHEHAVRANEALKAGHPERALPEFQALVDLDPENVDAQANLGVLLYFRKDFGPATEHLRVAVQRQADLFKIQGLLGLSELQIGSMEAAEADLKASLPHLAERAFRKQVGLTLIEVQGGRHDLAGASETAQWLRAKEPTDPEILYATYRTSTDLAGDSLLALSLASAESAQMQQAIAHELLRVREIAGAIASLRRAIRIDPRLPGVHFELAEALLASPNTADKAEAEQEYRIALQQNPADAQAMVRLGGILLERNSLQEAADLYKRALEKNPASADAAIGLARVDSERGEDEKAVPLLVEALSNDPTNVLAHFRLSGVYRKLRKTEDAKRELAEYQRLKDMKDKLQTVYSAMKIQAPNAEGQTASTDGTSR